MIVPDDVFNLICATHAEAQDAYIRVLSILEIQGDVHPAYLARVQRGMDRLKSMLQVIVEENPTRMKKEKPCTRRS